MSYKQFSPLSISEGGTNTRSYPFDHGVLVIEGGHQISINPGTLGHVLTSNGPALPPTFQVNPADAIVTLNADTGSATGATVTIVGGSNLNTFASASSLTVELVNSPSVSGSVTSGAGFIATTGGINFTNFTEGALITSAIGVTSTVTGAAGTILTANAAGTAPSFQAAPASAISITGDTGGALTGAAFTFTGGTTGLSFGGAVSTETLSGTLVVANGGTGTSTAFTQGSVVFAGALGVYDQDNANFFWDATDHQLGVGTNAPTIYNLVQFSNLPAFSHILTLTGSMSAVDAANHQHGLNCDGTYAPTAGSTISSSMASIPTFATPVGQTIASAAGIQISPTYSASNLGTITTAYGIWYDGGSALGAGTLTSQYGGYFATPVAGTNTAALYADNLNINIAASGSPVAGTINASSTISSGVAGSSIGGYNVSGNTSGTISILPQAAAGTYNFNLPTTAGNVGEVLTSAGGVGAPMTWAAASSGGFAWNDVTGATQAMSVGNGYIGNDGAVLVTMTLPATAAVGDLVAAQGSGTGLITIAQNAGQTIHFNGVNSTTGVGGTVSTTSRYDAITLICIVANTDWAVNSSIGIFNVV